MPATITVASADHADLDDVALLFDAYRRFYRQPSDIEGARRFLQARMDADESAILVARMPEHDGPVGFTQLYPFFSSVRMRGLWVLNDLFV
ncbi:MAG: GNAT family N-acetyltransferase, partial [Bacteroidota bacterium]